MEQHLFAMLAGLFGDQETKIQIERGNNPVKIKGLGKKIKKNFDSVIWSSKINEILIKGLLEKFRQNPYLHSKLMATSDSVIVEANRLILNTVLDYH